MLILLIRVFNRLSGQVPGFNSDVALDVKYSPDCVLYH